MNRCDGRSVCSTNTVSRVDSGAAVWWRSTDLIPVQQLLTALRCVYTAFKSQIKLHHVGVSRSHTHTGTNLHSTWVIRAGESVAAQRVVYSQGKTPGGFVATVGAVDSRGWGCVCAAFSPLLILTAPRAPLASPGAANLPCYSCDGGDDSRRRVLRSPLPDTSTVLLLSVISGLLRSQSELEIIPHPHQPPSVSPRVSHFSPLLWFSLFSRLWGESSHMILSFSFHTEKLALRATPSQGFVTRNRRRREEREEGDGWGGGREERKKGKEKREFNPLCGTSWMDLSASPCPCAEEVSPVRTKHTAERPWRCVMCQQPPLEHDLRVCVCVCVCVRGAAACVRPQPTTPAGRITAGTREDFKKGTQTGLRPLASLNEGPRPTQSRGTRQPRGRIETASFGRALVCFQTKCLPTWGLTPGHPGVAF